MMRGAGQCCWLGLDLLDTVEGLEGLVQGTGAGVWVHAVGRQEMVVV